MFHYVFDCMMFHSEKCVWRFTLKDFPMSITPLLTKPLFLKIISPSFHLKILQFKNNNYHYLKSNGNLWDMHALLLLWLFLSLISKDLFQLILSKFEIIKSLFNCRVPFLIIFSIYSVTYLVFCIGSCEMLLHFCLFNCKFWIIFFSCLPKENKFRI